MARLTFLFVALCLAALSASADEGGRSPPPFMLVLVDSPEGDMACWQSLLRAMERRRGAVNAFGHCWIYLEGWQEGRRVCLEGGHSGEGGPRPPYLEGVMDLLEYGHVAPSREQLRAPRYEADPIRYLWEERDDGFFQRGGGGHRPTVAALLVLDDASFDRVLEWVCGGGYRFKEYSLTGRHCVHFCLEALRVAGLPLAVRPVAVAIPETIRWGGATLRLRCGERYSSLPLLTPAALAQALDEAVAAGRLRRGEALYRRLCR